MGLSGEVLNYNQWLLDRCTFMSFWSLSFIVIALTLQAADVEEVVCKRVYAHLVIHDPSSACEEARQALQRFPDRLKLWEAYMNALAKSGDEKGLWKAWKRYVELNPDAYKKHEVLENIAWGIIENGFRSSLPLVRLVSLLGAFFSQDARGVALLKAGMEDCNSHVREIAVRMSSELKDCSLRDEILSLFRKEKCWSVRIQIIHALGTMKITEARQDLVAIVANEKAMAEERAGAIEALVNMFEHASREEVKRLALSNRAGLRMLACQVVTHLDQKNNIDLIIPLLFDPQSEVRGASLKALGILRVNEYQSQPIASFLYSLLNDPEPLNALSAAWVLTINQSSEGIASFKKWLNDPSRKIRVAAAAALAATGRYGFPTIIQMFENADDPYVRMNLAFGMISQRINVENASNALYEGLMTQNEKWMWTEDKDQFRALAPSDIKHDDSIANYPEAVNQKVRLEILNDLAIMKHPKAQEAIREFLQEQTWGVTGIASALLLTEGDESAVILVKNLLHDPDQKIRVQAALILAAWGEGEESISILQKAYGDADRDMKERILEGIGKIGSPTSLPFLVERLQESYQMLRLVAASALLECLYH